MGMTRNEISIALRAMTTEEVTLTLSTMTDDDRNVAFGVLIDNSITHNISETNEQYSSEGNDTVKVMTEFKKFAVEKSLVKNENLLKPFNLSQISASLPISLKYMRWLASVKY